MERRGPIWEAEKRLVHRLAAEIREEIMAYTDDKIEKTTAASRDTVWVEFLYLLLQDGLPAGRILNIVEGVETRILYDLQEDSEQAHPQLRSLAEAIKLRLDRIA